MTTAAERLQHLAEHSPEKATKAYKEIISFLEKHAIRANYSYAGVISLSVRLGPSEITKLWHSLEAEEIEVAQFTTLEHLDSRQVFIDVSWNPQEEGQTT